jgi:hypothetical protein
MLTPRVGTRRARPPSRYRLERATPPEQSWGQMIARRWRLTLLLAALGGAVLIPAAIADTVAPPG